MKRAFELCLLAGFFCAPSIAAAGADDDRLIVHEWSTFTCLQDENGKAVGGINIEDVPVPETLHKIAPGSLLPVTESGETTAEAPRCHSQVTMRLEKAVVSFYPTPDFDLHVNAEVGWSRGWLTQYSPAASIVESWGFTRDHVGSLDFQRSSLEWRDIILHPVAHDLIADTQSSPDANAPKPAQVEVKGDLADCIVYRGVANQSAPLRVIRSGPEFIITSAGKAQIELPQLWLSEIAANGRNSVRVLHPFNEETAFLVRTPARFTEEDSSPDCIDALKSDLKAAAQRAGLFEPEAGALVEALSIAHFRRVGLRLFFIAPEKSIMPYFFTRITTRARHGRWSSVESRRVTVGCIEIVTPEQRALLARIAAGGEDQSVTGLQPKAEMLSEDRWHELQEMYAWLGQFGNALTLDEQRRRPGPILQAFIQRFHLEGYTPKSRFERPGR